MSNNLNRSRSLKSTRRRANLQKKRPNTWTGQVKRLSLLNNNNRISPRISKWCEKQQFNNQRQTIGTISTLTTHSDIITLNTKRLITVIDEKKNNIFHTQSTLFLFGFLWFPCWWIGGYYLKIQNDTLNTEEKQVLPIHPSLIANGKTCSKIFWIMPQTTTKSDTVSLFYKCNRIMSLISIVLILFIIILLVWYYVGYIN